MTERPVSVERAAEWLGVSARTVRREIADGRLPAAKVRGIIRILPADLSHPATPAGRPDRAQGVAAGRDGI